MYVPKINTIVEQYNNDRGFPFYYLKHILRTLYNMVFKFYNLEEHTIYIYSEATTMFLPTTIHLNSKKTDYKPLHIQHNSFRFKIFTSS